jgi:hypothetical protein
VQECKEPKVEMYKPIWGLMFKCNGSGIQFNLIQFSQEYSNQRNMRKEKKKTNKNTKCNKINNLPSQEYHFCYTHHNY